jgi:Ser/Thr protein kinase RdoA (MazF antagonist)
MSAAQQQEVEVETEQHQHQQLSDEEWRKLLKPKPSKELVIELMKTHFASSHDDDDEVGVVVVVVVKKELDSYDDCNFWISMKDSDYLVKFHNGVESKSATNAMMANDDDKQEQDSSVIHYQYAIMKALEDHKISASRPIVPTTTRTSPHDQQRLLAVKVPVCSQDHSPYECIVSVYRWVPGNTMQSFQVLPMECLADAGRLLGKIHHAFDKSLPINEDTLPQAAHRYHQWDGKHTNELLPYLQYIHDEKRRAMILSIIETFDSALIQSGVAATYFRTSVNHGDYNDANILVNDQFQVTGVIDFGDSTAR